MILGSHKKSNRGFTLIEMLAVIGIIGILASVTLSSLSNARRHARDKGIQASMQGILVEAAMFRAKSQNSYLANGSMCGALKSGGGGVNNADNLRTRDIINKINTDNGAYAAPLCTVPSASVFSVRVRLNNGSWYCVDSTKYFGQENGTHTGGSCNP